MERSDTARRWPGSGLESRIGLAALTAAVLVAAMVRLAFSDYSLWFDELASVFFASQPTERLWSAWMLRETNPPLFAHRDVG